MSRRHALSKTLLSLQRLCCSKASSGGSLCHLPLSSPSPSSSSSSCARSHLRPFASGTTGGDDDGVRSNATSSVGRSDQGSTAPRFYKRATVEAEDESKTLWCIKLDGRKLKTPSLRVLQLPNANLAHAIAMEWEYQSTNSIRPFTMPLMQLATTAVDRTPLDRDENVRLLLRYIHSDPGLCFVDEEDSPLGKAHEKGWRPVLDWLKDDLKNQPKESVEKLRTYLYSLDAWEFTCVHVLSTAVKSLVLAMGVLHGQLTVKEAIYLSRLEEEMQIEEWGMVEGGHDIDRADQNVRVAAPTIFMKLYKGI